MIVVSDTSAITSLIQIGHLTLLQKLHGKVLIPRAVCQELVRSHQALPGFLEVRDVSNRERVVRLEAELDLGEAEAIVLAGETNADLLLIDEKLGRRVAMREGIRISGLMALLVNAKRRGLIRSVREMTGQLESQAGFRVSNAVKLELFREANE
jgi:predicted nucleic acid-binding protein